MISSDNLCMGCMRETGGADQCPHCGFISEAAQIPPYLPIRTVIANRYLVGKMLEYNGEGATYIGWDIAEKKAVKIREFIPDSFTTRTTSNPNLQIMRGSEDIFAELRQSFEELWTRLARLRGLSALISVTDVIEAYGTSYAVYEHFEGITLRDFLLRSKTGYIPWEKARQLLMPILSTLGTLHSSGIIHKGISPSTLIISSDGKIKITGFCTGAARTARSDLNSQLFDGYAAIEQYGFDGSQGTWTDIYSFAAVLYRTLIGSDPIPAKERMSNDRLMVPGKFAEALPAYVINGLINALQILPEDRTRTVEQLRAELSASPVATAVSGQYQQRKAAPPPAPSGAPAPHKPASTASSKNGGNKKKSKGGAQIVVTSAIISIAIGLALFIILAFTVFRDRLSINLGNTSATTSASVEQTQAEPIAVPNFIGRSYLDISSNPVFNQNFEFGDPEYVYDKEVAEGYIVGQSVQPNDMVAPGTKITLFVSKGEEEIILPNVIGSDYEEAVARLEELGFVCQRNEISQGNHRENEIVSMSPSYEKAYPPGTTVYLIVYTPETELVTDENGEIIPPEELEEDENSAEDTPSADGEEYVPEEE
ncbi:MAG: PASTA domain-containing protein [Clostridia bacterium]|nr:PASTA domain-containing protein [Clostridia bacterium]